MCFQCQDYEQIHHRQTENQFCNKTKNPQHICPLITAHTVRKGNSSKNVKNCPQILRPLEKEFFSLLSYLATKGCSKRHRQSNRDRNEREKSLGTISSFLQTSLSAPVPRIIIIAETIMHTWNGNE